MCVPLVPPALLLPPFTLHDIVPRLPSPPLPFVMRYLIPSRYLLYVVRTLLAVDHSRSFLLGIWTPLLTILVDVVYCLHNSVAFSLVLSLSWYF